MQTARYRRLSNQTASVHGYVPATSPKIVRELRSIARCATSGNRRERQADPKVENRGVHANTTTSSRGGGEVCDVLCALPVWRKQELRSVPVERAEKTGRSVLCVVRGARIPSYRLCGGRVTQLSLGDLGGIVLSPDMLDEQRGAWCSPAEYTAAAGHFDLDPFTNPRSTLRASYMCMLESGGDGFGLNRRDVPGSFFIKEGSTFTTCPCEHCGDEVAALDFYDQADASWKVWIQPPYDIVLEAIAHYGHTRFVALLRLDTSTLWFEQLWNLCEVIMVPRRDRLEFVPPPGVKPSSNPFPHGLYYRRAEDVTAAVRELCYPWPCPAYPWREDPLEIAHQHDARERVA